MKRVALGALVLIALCVMVSGSAVASDLHALWMSLTPEGPAQTDFPSGTDTVYAVFEYTDFIKENVRVVVSDYKGTIVFQKSETFSGSGTASIRITSGQVAFPDGPYVTTLYFAGHYLTRAVEWTVGGVDSPPTPTAFPPARLELKPSALVFSASQGGANPPAQRVLISNNTAIASAWNATTNAPWLRPAPSSGSTPALLSISVDAAGLPAGAYHGQVTVTADGVENSPQIVDVALAVSPPQGTTTLDVPAIAEGTGWAVSDETSGNHFGEDEIRVGVQDSRDHVGGLEFDLSDIPDGSDIRAAAVVLTGLRWETQPSAGNWVLELLGADVVDGWARRTYAGIATPTAQVVLLPDHSVNNLGADIENVWYLDVAGLNVLESLIQESDSVVLRLRYEPQPAGESSTSGSEDSLFVWQADAIFRVNFMPGAGPAQTATPAPGVTTTPTSAPTELSATATPTVATPVPTATPPAPPPPPGGLKPVGMTLAGLASTLVLASVVGIGVQRFAK